VSDLNTQACAALLAVMAEYRVPQAAVARRLGRSKSYVNQRVHGTYALSLDIVGAVLDLAQLSPDAFLGDLAQQLTPADPTSVHSGPSSSAP